MSYCRFSSDNFKCDVCCYESMEGFMTHVAASRFVPDVPPLPEYGTVSEKELVNAYKKQTKALKEVEPIPIGLPYDGQTFVDDTESAMLDRLKHLKKIGYNVPGWVLTKIEEEIKETP